MSDQAMVISPQEQFFLSLGDTEAAKQLRLLCEDVFGLQAQGGRTALQLGRRVKQVKDLISQHDPSLWDRWADAFLYTRDYANRMIQIAENFDENTYGIEQLTLGHLRAIDRFRDTGDRELLTRVVADYKLSVPQTRQLSTLVKKGKVDLNQLMAENPDVKSAVNDLIKQSTAEARSKNEELKNKLREMNESAEETSKELQTAQSERNLLVDHINKQEAAVDVGEGDPELGKLRIELEQEKQRNSLLQVTVDEMKEDLSAVRKRYEGWLNSPAGMAKQDVRKSLDDITRFFSHTMTPVMLLNKINKLNSDEAREELSKVLDLLENWLEEVSEGVRENA